MAVNMCITKKNEIKWGRYSSGERPGPEDYYIPGGKLRPEDWISPEGKPGSEGETFPERGPVRGVARSDLTIIVRSVNKSI